MSSLRSDRAKRRSARLRSTRIAIILILLVVASLGAYFLISIQRQQSKTTQPENTITTQSGLSYQDLNIGNGQEAKPGNTVTVQYTGWLEDGTKFDSSFDHGKPFSFVLGQGNVIRGWDEGVAGMKSGGKRRLTIPPDLAYGAQGISGVIPPNSTLIFEVELVSVQ